MDDNKFTLNIQKYDKIKINISFCQYLFKNVKNIINCSLKMYNIT